MGEFSELLNQYMEEYQCSSKYLAEKCHLSMAKVSRLRNGLIVPTKNEQLLSDIAATFKELASQKGIVDTSGDSIYDNLNVYAEEVMNFDNFRKKIDTLISILDININELSLFCNCDPSLLYRIRKSNQIPRKPLVLARKIADYISIHFSSSIDKNRVIDIVGSKENDLSNDNCSDIIYDYLTGDDSKDSLKKFIFSIDSFDYDAFLRCKSIGKIKIPTLPFQMPSNKTYYGIQGMEEGVLAFLKATVLSRSKRDVVIYNDHPIEYFTTNPVFVEKWLKALGVFVLKGLKIYIIHVLDRPIDELMAGIENWVPLYMTGKVVPFYLQNSEQEKRQYNHILMTSGNVSLSGDTIANHPESGQFNFSKSNSEVERCRLRAEQLIQNATPLVKIYVHNNREQYEEALDELRKTNTVVTNFLTVPPIYTISDALLDEILKRNNVSVEDANEIKSFVNKERMNVKDYLANGVLYESISLLNKTDFTKNNVYLSLSDLLIENGIKYTWDEYKEHFELTQEFAKTTENYYLDECEKPDFQNVKISVYGKKTAIVSKSVSPSIHFVVQNSNLVKALLRLRKIK